ncbi:MAG: phage major capsid protein [Chloroflexota bacterium]
MNLLDLRRKRAAKIAALRQLLDNADNEERGLNEQETKDYEQLQADIENLDNDIARRERLDEMERGLNDAPSRPEPDQDANIGMSDEEVREYSIVRAIRALANNDWRGAELEREASEEVARRMDTTPQGFFVPNDWVTRDLSVGTPTAGGHTVSTDLLASSFIELLRNRLALVNAGARMLDGLEGNIAIPRQTGGATAYWVGEAGSPTESQQTVDQVTMTPHTAGAFTDFSRRLILQSSIGVEAFVRQDLASVIALAIDYAGLHGDSGANANQPDGLEQLAGIGAVAGGTNGAAPDWADIVSLETEVAVDNADVGNLAYITNAAVRGKLKTTEKYASSNGMSVWGEGSNPLNGYRAIVSNQVRSDLTKGSGTNLSAIFFGNWADMIMGLWSGLDIMVDPYTHSTSGTLRVVSLQDVDFAFRHAQSFSAMLDAITT